MPLDRPAPTVVPLEAAQLDALELLVDGFFAPADGYCLAGRAPKSWPFDVTLTLTSGPGSLASEGARLLLTDPDGTPLGEVQVTDRYDNADGTVAIAGPVKRLADPEHAPAREFRVSMSDDFSDSLVAVFDRVPQAADIARAIAEAAGDSLVLLAVSDGSRSGAQEGIRVVEALNSASRWIPGAAVRFVAAGSPNPSTTQSEVVDVVLSAVGARRVLDFTGDDKRTDVRSSGVVLLFTGLSGSGKSTIARGVAQHLDARESHHVLLDGDDARRVLSGDLGFSAADREQNLRRLGWVAARIAEAGGIAICAPIAPTAASRRHIRAMAEEVGRFILVYVATPLEECERRDRKGLYARARAGEIHEFTGIDAQYQVPNDADLVLDTVGRPVAECVRAVVDLLDDDPRSPD